MRPPEQDITFVLYQLDCRSTNDSGGDEPYMWILGFKVDADTIGPPQVGSLVPTLGVQVFEGAPASPFLLGAGSIDDPGGTPTPIKIPAALGTRSFRLRPDLLLTGDWFAGLTGVIALLWDQDAFSPSTSEAGFKAFRKAFGPALASELTNLINGTYDLQLSQDVKGNVVSAPGPSQLPLQWRLDRLGNTAARNNAVKAITDNVKGSITGTIHDALQSAAGWDELLDPDDLLGVNAQVYLGQELSSTVRDFTMDFTDDADYTARGHSIGSRIRLARLDSAVTGAVKTFDGQTSLTMRVCWFPPRQYSVFTFKVSTTTRFELLNLRGEPPAAVRWFLDDKPLLAAGGSVNVTFESADQFFGPPQDALAFKYPGGNGSLSYQVTSSTLQISNQGGEGVYFGQITALYAYPGDPNIFPSPDLPLSQLRNLCYEQTAELSVIAVELTMDAAYQNDVKKCKRVVHEIDRKHIAVNYGKAFINPGDPPRNRQVILDRVIADARVANAIGLHMLPQSSETVSKNKTLALGRDPMEKETGV